MIVCHVEIRKHVRQWRHIKLSETCGHVERVIKMGAPDERDSKRDVTPVVVVPHKGDGEGTAYVLKPKLPNRDC